MKGFYSIKVYDGSTQSEKTITTENHITKGVLYNEGLYDPIMGSLVNASSFFPPNNGVHYAPTNGQGFPIRIGGMTDLIDTSVLWLGSGKTPASVSDSAIGIGIAKTYAGYSSFYNNISGDISTVIEQDATNQNIYRIVYSFRFIIDYSTIGNSVVNEVAMGYDRYPNVDLIWSRAVLPEPIVLNSPDDHAIVNYTLTGILDISDVSKQVVINGINRTVTFSIKKPFTYETYAALGKGNTVYYRKYTPLASYYLTSYKDGVDLYSDLADSNRPYGRWVPTGYYKFRYNRNLIPSDFIISNDNLEGIRVDQLGTITISPPVALEQSADYEISIANLITIGALSTYDT